MTWEAKPLRPELDIDLNPVSLSPGTRTVTGASGGGRLRADAKVQLEIAGSQPLRFFRADT
jgi:hypothetical protein